jgi:hypothetical protein
VITGEVDGEMDPLKMLLEMLLRRLGEFGEICDRGLE